MWAIANGGWRRSAWSAAASGLVLTSLGAPAARADTSPSLEELGRLSIEELADIDVSSVSKTGQPLSDAPAAIFVITHDDLARSGATNMAEALRFAPNLQVARITANSYAVSARGFNGSAADKLLVLVDGRSVYTPFSHGVFWDLQDTPPEIIDRIEVISGPGATLWGANAVNGVINIVTRPAAATQGGGLQLGIGDRRDRAGLQYGGRVGEDIAYRVHLTGVAYEHSRSAAGVNAKDGWGKAQGGFRLDWTPSSGDLFTVQGEAYRGDEDEPTSADQEISGFDLLGRWTRHTGGDGVLQVQAYYDELTRSTPGRFDDNLRTYDLDLQHSFTWNGVHQIIWGGGYRVTRDSFPIVPQPPRVQFFDPVGRTLVFGNIFIQDSIALTPTLKLTLGAKLEDDPYSGVEPLPSARLSWKVSDTALLWAAVSRAVRAPSRLDRDFVERRGAGVFLRGADFQPETLIAYELGYRGQPTPRSSLSISAFYNVYDDLRSFEFSPGGRLPILFANMLEGETYGVEAWGAYQVADWWRLSAGANWLNKDLRFKPASSRIAGVQIAGDDPTYQASLRSTMSQGPSLTLDFDLRQVGALPNPASPAFAELGARLRWAVSDRLEVVVDGENLLHDHHAEFGSASANVQLGAIGVESARSIFIDTRLRF